MRIEEFDNFKSELKQLCVSLGKPYTDALGQGYWRVLRDIPLAEIEANVERILMSATKDTKFPKPTELRSTPTKIQAAMPDDAVKLNNEVWREKFARDRRLAEIDLAYHQNQRVMASSDPGSPEHAMALDAARHIEKAHGNPRYFSYS